jgi:putative multicomponent Na+:H+ antiporter subunit B
MNDSYIYIITALLPLAASMVVSQANPYNALVIRGILGAVAAMLYAILGAPDVALTEALVGTMLAITLYAVAVRSSLVMRLGVLTDELTQTDQDSLADSEGEHYFGQLIQDLRTIFRKRHMRVELVPYPNTQALQRALIDKEVHATCVPPQQVDPEQTLGGDANQLCHTAVRLKRIYEIMQAELATPAIMLTYVNVPDSGEVNQ